MTDRIARLLSKVGRGYGESTLRDLFDVLELPNGESTLSKVQLVSEVLAQMGLKIVPDINQGEIDSARRVVFTDEGIVTAETIRLELAQREGESLELKSSLLFDHDRAKAQSNTAHEALKSEEVLHSCLKTIAAFLTSSGGTLIVGVDDSTAILGIAYDFACMTDKPERRNPDGWELVLRNYVQGRFKDGAMVNDYVRCSILAIDEQFVARVNVSPRRQLSFLKHKEGFALYRRQGNQTVQVGIDQVEEFINLRNSLFD